MSNAGLNSNSYASAALYGTELSCVAGIDPNMTEVAGSILVIQSCCRRLNMRRGSALDRPNDGLDLCAWLSQDIRITSVGTSPDLARLAQEIPAELEKDDRVFDSKVTAMNYYQLTKVLRMDIQVVTALGPFTMTIEVSQLSLSLLAVN